MRKSTSITFAILGGLMLTGSLCGGCGGGSPRYRTLYDKQHNVVPRDRWMGADGQPVELYDENGNPVPADQVRSAYNQPTSYSSSRYRYGPSFMHFGSPWSSSRSWGSSSGSSSGSHFGSSGSGSVSRGGFGSSGHSSGGSSS